MQLIDRISDGRTDLVFEYLAAGNPASSKNQHGVPLIQLCAYYGDVSAIKHLHRNGATLESLGENLSLSGAAFHGHWRLCQFLIESGANVNYASPDSGETPLHAALCKSSSVAHSLVVKVLLANGADPNATTKPGAESDSFMRDVRTKAETPLHRAAAFANEDTIQLLIEAGANVSAKDMNGDSPLAWASWYLRPDTILRRLCYNGFSIREGRLSMEAYLQGTPRSETDRPR